MKKVFVKFAVASSAIVAVVGAFAFTPKVFANKVYVFKNSTGWTYSNTQPTTIGCIIETGGACTFSTTATAAFFNTHNALALPTSTTLPVQHPQVTIVTTDKSYHI